MSVLEALLIVLYMLLIAPVGATVDVSLHGGLEIAVWGRVWGLPVNRQLKLSHGASGLAVHGGTDQSIAETVRSGLADAGTVLRSNHARRYLKRHVHLLRLDVLVRLSTGDAAKTAVVTGVLQQLSSTVQRLMQGRACIAVQPDFFAEQTKAYARCILFTRLGNLLIVTAAVYLARRLEQAEHRAGRAA